MKKLKLNVDKETVRKFFLEHSEKVVLGGVIACAVVIVYLALVQESFSKTPKDLEKSAVLAGDHIKNNDPAPPESCELVDYETSVLLSLEETDVGPYEWDKAIDREIFPPSRPRGVPKLYQVEKLRGVSGAGPFTTQVVRQPAGGRAAATGKRPSGRPGNVIRGQRWVVLTGLVPVDQQAAAFERYYRDCVQSNPKTDVAEYLYFSVERAEVTASADPAQLQWISRHVGNASAAQTKAGQEKFRPGKEIVDKQYINETLVFPLSELAGRPWDESVAYPPVIPLPVEAADPASRGKPGLRAPGTPDEPGDDVPYGTPTEEPQPNIGEVPGPETVAKQETDGPRYMLFRFFDFSVEPGKRYRYRVRLWLDNPNYGVNPLHLKDVDPSVLPKGTTGETTELSRSKWLWTDWSDPTDVISVPRDTRLLAVSVMPSVRVAAPPTGKMMVVKWVNDYGKWAHMEFSATRGKVVNFPDCHYPEVREARPGRDDDDTPKRPAATDAIGSIPVDYITDALVLDMRGGKRRFGDLRLDDPGEILVLDADGALVLYNEVDDLAEYRQRTGTGTADEPGGTDIFGLPEAGSQTKPPVDGNLGDLEGIFPAPIRSRRR